MQFGAWTCLEEKVIIINGTMCNTHCVFQNLNELYNKSSDKFKI